MGFLKVKVNVKAKVKVKASGGKNVTIEHPQSVPRCGVGREAGKKRKSMVFYQTPSDPPFFRLLSLRDARKKSIM